MRYSKKAVLEFLADDETNRCCPNCRSKGPFLILPDQRKDNDRYDSYRCNCGQRWTVAIELIISPTVEYREDVGDMADPTRHGML